MKFMESGQTGMPDSSGDEPANPGEREYVETDPDETPDVDRLAPAQLARAAPHLEAVATLLTQPALARVYVYVCYWGPVDPPTIVDQLDLSKSTAYEYIDRLEARGLVDRDASTRPQQLAAEPVVIIEPNAPLLVTLTVLHGLALQEIDEGVASFIDRHGVGTLIAALRGAGLHAAGKTTQRMVASDIDVRDFEAMLVIEALTPALAAGRQHDPYFDQLFPDVATEMEFPDDIGVAEHEIDRQHDT